jgi:hypothetical protein
VCDWTPSGSAILQSKTAFLLSTAAVFSPYLESKRVCDSCEHLRWPMNEHAEEDPQQQIFARTAWERERETAIRSYQWQPPALIRLVA